MNNPQQRIVVGIDGSDAAINAAKWAAAEALSRNVPLRLIHAVPRRNAGDDSLDIQYAQTALRAADAALQATGQPVKVECDIVRGSSEDALIDESRGAAMVCVGSVGTGWVARKVLGSTADTLAHRAHCPVAVIRSRRGAEPDDGFVAVAVGESAGNDAVLEHGFREARLREAPILAMGVWRWGLGEIPYSQLQQRLGPWVARHREVHVQPAAARRGAAEFLAHTSDPVQLAVVGGDDADKVARIVGPITALGNGGCSVLVVRD
ncbi:universal stress protein [Mycobacterium paraffinicum]|uniref:Universal stress protein n=1 Tax=Mycobacterium paraffinicum TaxID=53378 RepID=A0A1Q4HT89_9MYCO|nr:universal stress protein [Mycobacterium paraffinicum]OJZ72832.1 universal stress protein [Mycobacterium paraffinicum]